MIPPGYTAPDFGAAQDKVGEATVQAIKQAKVTHVVDLSSVGAQRPDGTGPIKGLYRQEQRLNAVAGLNVVHLRPSSFMQNQYWSIPTIKQLNVNGSPMRGDLPQDMVSTEDIGTKAAELLDQLAFRGQSVVELAGPAPLTLQEATTVLGTAIGKPDLKYVQFPADEARKAMLGMGMSASAVDLMLEMEESFNKELIRFERPPAKGTTTFQEFAKNFARAYLSPEPAAV